MDNRCRPGLVRIGKSENKGKHNHLINVYLET